MKMKADEGTYSLYTADGSLEDIYKATKLNGLVFRASRRSTLAPPQRTLREPLLVPPATTGTGTECTQRLRR